jgi:DNA recombination protein RmuC
MALITGLLGFVCGGLICATIAWVLFARARAAADEYRRESEAERIERVRLESECAKVPTLESDRQTLRTRLESLSTECARLASEAGRVPGLETQTAGLQTELAEVRAVNIEARTQLREQTRAHQEKLAALIDVRGGIDEKLAAVTAEALRTSQGSFLELANAVFEKHKAGADAELADRQAAVAELISPLTDALKNLHQETQELERSRSAAYGALSTELKAVADTQHAVRTETSKLVQALRASPKTRGRWGEHTLQNVLELSGLSPYCDFSTEETFDREGDKVRPDVVIRLPGGRSLVVDSKTPFQAYLDAIEAATDIEREQHLMRHAAQTREHVRKLAAKTYWDRLTDTPDYVVMFIPGENFYSAAVERDPALFNDAAAARVVIATPSTLIALAKAVAFGWRQEKVADNAQRVHELGRELYKRMTTMAEHIQACGGGLSKAVKGFNDFVGSLEHCVMPQVRRFNELEVEGTASPIERLEPVELEPRLLREDRDFAGQLTVSANSDTDAERRPAA